ncbi:MAG: DUF3160 domain-containing protein [Tissierellia bacterium]|nr:DUF3160 domain-containing protein [Tissierellia bacterium]
MKKISLLLVVVLIASVVLPLSACKKPKEKDDPTKDSTVVDTKDDEAKKDDSQKEDSKDKDSKDTGNTMDEGAGDFLDQYDEAVEVPYTPIKISPSLPNQGPNQDLSNVKNRDLFVNMSEDQKKALVDKGFFIGERLKFRYSMDDPLHRHMHEVYDKNEYANVANFITTDSVLQIFHLFYDNFLMDLEARELLPAVEELVDHLIADGAKQYENVKDEKLKELAMYNLAYFATIKGILAGGTPDLAILPDEAIAMAEKELQNIEAQSFAYSAVMDMDMDFSQMKPRGHYTKSEDLKKYFKAVMYMGQAGFFPVNMDTGQRNEDVLARALLMTHVTTNNEESYRLWSRAHDPIDFLVETADDLEIKDFANILYGVYGKDPDLNQLLEEDKMDKAYDYLVSLPAPKIASFKGYSFRLMSQRAVIDNVWMQNLVEIWKPGKPSNRPIYSGKDLFGVFGMKAAEDLQMADERNKKWDQYETRFKETKEKASSMKEEDWTKNLYRGWLWALTELTPEWGEGYPHFMQSEEWKKKDLNAGLGSWAEIKHDTLLYGKQVVAQMGGPSFVLELQKGYVEPNVELYNKLIWLTDYTEKNLSARGLLRESTRERLLRYMDQLEFLRDVSIKELTGEEVTEEDYQRIAYIGGEMEYIILDFLRLSDENWTMLDYNEDMCLVADLMTVPENTWGLKEGEFYSIGLATPRSIYVVYPVGDEFFIGRGSVFSVYEFISPTRLNDEEWRKKARAEDLPEEGDWLDGILEEEPFEFEEPDSKYFEY